MQTQADQKTSMLREVLDGLGKEQKTLPSKFFYDERGSQLFDEITKLEEYYPTRTERRILEENINGIGAYLGVHISLFEPGSGSSDKSRILLNNLPNIDYYVPIDISGDYLFKVADQLQEEYPNIKVLPVQADYTHPFELPDVDPVSRNVVFFPGSTVGNFDMQTVHRFLEVMADIAGEDGGVLIGVDLKKDRSVLEAAYNDAKGITAEFNKNILDHINHKTGADFETDNFSHKAIWNEEKGRIEMHLISEKSHSVSIDEEIIHFEKGESIHTENSHKYSLEEFEEIVSPWFNVEKVWTDKRNYFSVQYLVPV